MSSVIACMTISAKSHELLACFTSCVVNLEASQAPVSAALTLTERKLKKVLLGLFSVLGYYPGQLVGKFPLKRIALLRIFPVAFHRG